VPIQSSPFHCHGVQSSVNGSVTQISVPQACYLIVMQSVLNVYCYSRIFVCYDLFVVRLLSNWTDCILRTSFHVLS